MSSAQASFRTGMTLAIAGAIAFSGKAIIVKLAYRHGVDAVTFIMLRMLMSLPLFLLLAWWASRQTHARANPLTWRDAGPITGLGFIGYYLSSYLDFLGLQYISASLERLILYLNPTMVMVLSWLMYRKRIQPVRIGAMAISYSGVLLVFGHELTVSGSHVALGSTLVFVGALTYALYLIFSGQMVQRIGSLRLVGWASSAACVFSLLQFVLLRPLSDAWVSEPVLWLSLLNATACTVAPVLMVMMAIERIGAGLTSQAGMIGPMATIALGVVLLGEPLNAWIFAGTALVLGGVYMVSKYGGQ